MALVPCLGCWLSLSSTACFFMCQCSKDKKAEGHLEAEGQELISFLPHSMVSQA